MWRTAALVFWMITTGLIVHAEGEIKAHKKFDAWSAFVDRGDCWVASFLHDYKGGTNDDLLVFVTFHKHDPQPKVSILNTSSVTLFRNLKISSGSQEFLFQFDGDIAFPPKEDDIAVFRMLLSGEPTIISSNNEIRDKVIGRISYSGFQSAYNLTSKACDFHYSGDIDSDAEFGSN